MAQRRVIEDRQLAHRGAHAGLCGGGGVGGGRRCRRSGRWRSADCSTPVRSWRARRAQRACSAKAALVVRRCAGQDAAAQAPSPRARLHRRRRRARIVRLRRRRRGTCSRARTRRASLSSTCRATATPAARALLARAPPRAALLRRTSQTKNELRRLLESAEDDHERNARAGACARRRRSSATALGGGEGEPPERRRRARIDGVRVTGAEDSRRRCFAAIHCAREGAGDPAPPSPRFGSTTPSSRWRPRPRTDDLRGHVRALGGSGAPRPGFGRRWTNIVARARALLCPGG